MARSTTIKELRSMQPADLRKEIGQQQTSVAKLHLAVKVGGDKNAGKLKQEKRQLARMKTILREKETGETEGTKETKETKQPSRSSA